MAGDGTRTPDAATRAALEAAARAGGTDAATVADSPGARAHPPPPDTTLPTLAPPATPETERYELAEELGRGGSGRVTLARDRAIGRKVAIKILLNAAREDRELVSRFTEEARITAQLEHPSVIPVYEVGVLPSGEPFYTMPVVPRRSLRDVLRTPALRAEWPMVRLCTVFVQVCRAVAFAHARGVIHRDLKPSNLLLGGYGEVYVADWGIAKVVAGGEIDLPATPTGATRPGTAQGYLLGTPGYMPPEQARGDWDEVDHRADLFALGAILYEILTGARPFPGATRAQVIGATLQCVVKRPRDVAPQCPLVLEDVCLRCLQRDKNDRPASAAEVAEAVESWLEGAAERARRQAEAQRLADVAREPATRWAQLGDERRRLAAEARRLLGAVQPWEAVERKRAAWELQDRARAAEVQAARALAEAVELYAQALAHEPRHAGARAGLAALYWARAAEAAAERREPERLYYESRVLDHDDGWYAARLKADALLTLQSDPPGAEVTAWRWEERDRVLVRTTERPLGRTPLRAVELPAGSWLLVLHHPQYRETRYPILCERGEHHEAVVRLYTDGEIGAGYVYVPRGSFVLGGDPDASEGLPAEQLTLDDFAIARFAVTMGEYLAWIDRLEEVSPAAAQRHLPRSTGGEQPLARRDGRGHWVPHEDLVEQEGRAWCPPDQLGLVPAFGLDWFDADAFCRAHAARLPTEAEWEKAARGPDGRLFPWGDRFDPTFCKVRDSRKGLWQPEPIGVFAVDESPYGVRDMGGTVREWMADLHGSATAEDVQRMAQRPGPRGGETSFRIVRGGSWAGAELFARCASRSRMNALSRSTYIGLRPARSLPRRARGA